MIDEKWEEEEEDEKEDEGENMYDYLDVYLGYCEHYSSWLLALSEDFTVEDVLKEMNLRGVVIPSYFTAAGISLEMDDLFRTGNRLDDAEFFFNDLKEAQIATRSIEDFYTIVVKGEEYEQ